MTSMQVDSDSAPLRRVLLDLGQVLAESGGCVSSSLVVREREGEFSCAVAPGASHPMLLVTYDAPLSVPLGELVWSASTTKLGVESGLETLSGVQRHLLDLWLELVTQTDKLASVRRNVPSVALAHAPTRTHLAAGGYPDLAEAPDPDDAAQILLGWHSSGGRQQWLAAGSSTQSEVGIARRRPEARWRLIPLKSFVNHHPDGAPQVPIPGQFAVVTSPISNEVETFENYGDLDALHLLMRFGYVDSTARVVHSVPVEVASPHLGTLAIGRNPPRTPRQALSMNELAGIRRTEAGVRLGYLSARPGNRATVVALLAMLLQSAGGLRPGEAPRAAEQLVDDIAAANLRYYLELEALVDQADQTSLAAGESPPPIHDAVRQVSMRQRQRLSAMWGT